LIATTQPMPGMEWPLVDKYVPAFGCTFLAQRRKGLRSDREPRRERVSDDHCVRLRERNGNARKRSAQLSAVVGAKQTVC
jgi:hypothetical protein